MNRVVTIAANTVDEVRYGLLRATGGAWWHVSRKAETVLLRPLSGSGTPSSHSPVSLGDEFSGAVFVPYEVLALYTESSERRPRGVSFQDVDYWRSLARRYNADPTLWEPPVVPTTALRSHYEELRGNARAAAMECADAESATTKLSSLIVAAAEQLLTYRNLREGWVGEDARKGMDDSKFARDVALKLSEEALVAPDGHEYSFVAREIAPLRATAASALDSGAGGIDVLLASGDEARLPILVEVKGSTDRAAYLALVQSLTYASELITKNQRDRLAKFFPVFSALSEVNGPFADIWIVQETGKRDAQLAQTGSVAARLLRDPSVSTLLRRITFFELELGSGVLVPMMVR